MSPNLTNATPTQAHTSKICTHPNQSAAEKSTRPFVLCPGLFLSPVRTEHGLCDRKHRPPPPTGRPSRPRSHPLLASVKLAYQSPTHCRKGQLHTLDARKQPESIRRDLWGPGSGMPHSSPKEVTATRPGGGSSLWEAAAHSPAQASIQCHM